MSLINLRTNNTLIFDNVDVEKILYRLMRVKYLYNTIKCIVIVKYIKLTFSFIIILLLKIINLEEFTKYYVLTKKIFDFEH